MVLNAAQWIAVAGGVVYIVMTISFSVYSAYDKKKKKTTARTVSNELTGNEAGKEMAHDSDADNASDKERSQLAYYYSEQELMFNTFDEPKMQDQPPPYCERIEDSGVQTSDGLPCFDEEIMPQEK